MTHDEAVDVLKTAAELLHGLNRAKQKLLYPRILPYAHAAVAAGVEQFAAANDRLSIPGLLAAIRDANTRRTAVRVDEADGPRLYQQGREEANRRARERNANDEARRRKRDYLANLPDDARAAAARRVVERMLPVLDENGRPWIDRKDPIRHEMFGELVYREAAGESVDAPPPPAPAPPSFDTSRPQTPGGVPVDEIPW